jgi:hypothetical protein
MIRICLGIALAALPVAALAQDIAGPGPEPVLRTDQGFGAGPEFSFGAAVTARFDTSDSFDHAENELELTAEVANRGFHAGVILTSLYRDPSDDFEYELGIGYGREFGRGLSWDVNYATIGLDDSGHDRDELTGTFGFPVGIATEAAVAVIYDPDTGRSDQELGFETALTDQWSLVGLIGNSDRDGNTYGELGAIYQINDSWGVQVLYEDTSDSNGLLGFTFAYAFGS